MKKESKKNQRSFSEIKSYYEKPFLKVYELEFEGTIMDSASGGDAPGYEGGPSWS